MVFLNKAKICLFYSLYLTQLVVFVYEDKILQSLRGVHEQTWRYHFREEGEGGSGIWYPYGKVSLGEAGVVF